MCIIPFGDAISPLFHTMQRQINLELLDCSRFKNGCVLVKYRVKH